MIQILDLSAQYASIKPAIDNAIARVVASQQFILSQEVAAFESEIAAYLGTRNAIGVASGSDAILLALMALGIGAGKKVLTTPFSFFASAGAPARLGARPVFADIDPVTLNLDPIQARDALGREKIDAIVLVHIFGHAADVNAFQALSSEFGVPLIEDAAQAIGAMVDERKIGIFGRVGCFSFFPTKTLGAYGDAGLVVTDDDALALHLRRMRVHGSERRYFHDFVGVNSRLDSLQAAVLRAKLPHVDRWIERRRAIAKAYNAAFSTLPLTLPPTPAHATFHQYTLRVAESADQVARRGALQAHLAAAGIGTAVHYPRPLHLQDCFRELGHREGSFPIAESATDRVLSLPIYPELSNDAIATVIGAVTSFFK